MSPLYDPTTNHRRNPLGIDTPQPEFAWKNAGASGQTMYELEVATDVAFVDEAVMWRSGLVSQSDPFGVWYAGKALESRTSYYWRVRCRLTDETTTSWLVASFETGTLYGSEWRAHWISHPFLDKRDPRTLYFHKTIELAAPIVRGRAYASALGWYRLFVNDTDVSGPALVPRWTPFHNYTEYQIYDVAQAFRQGRNTIGLVVAEGRYRGRLGLFSKRARYGDRLAAFAEIDLKLADGSILRFHTDDSWRVGHGRIRVADPKDGERVDLRLPELPWVQSASPAPDDVQAITVTPPSRLAAEEVNRVTEIGRLAGRVAVSASGAQLIDFGQNFSGFARIRMSGQAGSRIKILYSEVLDSTGELAVDYLGLPGMNAEWFQRDEVILSGQPVTYTPWFTVHGFRYVSVQGLVAPLTEQDVEAIVVSSDLHRISEFQCSDCRLNRLWHNVLWSLRSNFSDTPTDCPTRERSGFTGDIQIFGPTAVQLVDADAYLRRYLRNLSVEQGKDGCVPPVIPAEDAPGRSKNVLRLAKSSVGWGDVAVMLPWTLYRYYGDIDVLRRQYDSAKAWVDQLASRAATKRSWRRRFRRTGRLEKYIVDTGYHWGEWLRPGSTFGSELVGNIFGRRASIATAYLAHSARLLSQIAAVIDRDVDAAHYRGLADSAAQAWREAFVTKRGSRIGDDKQDDYVRGLAFELLLPSERPAAAARLAELVEQADYHLGTGFLSTPMLLGTLADAGYAEHAFRILMQTTAPSWLGQIELGATTTWETWEGYRNGNPHSSHNHYAFGAVAAFLQERVAGLAPADRGYRRLRIEPLIIPGLTSASVAIQTPYGRAASGWQLDEHRNVTLRVTVPPGSAAEVKIGTAEYEIGPGEHTLTAPAVPIPVGHGVVVDRRVIGSADV